MIPLYIEDWLTIIEQMNNDNTYKLAWGRAIVECVNFVNYKTINNNIIVEFKDISRCMIKYYWNQIFFFNLKQSPYKDKNPVICTLVTSLIDRWKEINGNIPVWYDEEKVKSNDTVLFDKVLNKIIKTLHENVSYRFKNVQGGTKEIYSYTKKVDNIIISKDNALELKEYSIVISKLLNYKWTQLLEKFNFQPKIASKVSGISDNKIKRNNLTEYKEELLKEHNGKAIDFYSGKELDLNDISIDHVIPWSFIYSDDIWNLVITSKSNNSSKSNSICDAEVINRLNERNKNLLKLDSLSKKYKLSLEEAINGDYLDKIYYNCRLSL